jgi:hypothetical protein
MIAASLRRLQERHPDKIANIYRDSDGLWLELQPGWRASECDEVHQIHEGTDPMTFQYKSFLIVSSVTDDGTPYGQPRVSVIAHRATEPSLVTTSLDPTDGSSSMNTYFRENNTDGYSPADLGALNQAIRYIIESHELVDKSEIDAAMAELLVALRDQGEPTPAWTRALRAWSLIESYDRQHPLPLPHERVHARYRFPR